MTPHQVKTALQSLSDGDRVSILIDPRLSLLACRVAESLGQPCGDHAPIWVDGVVERRGDDLQLVWRHAWDRIPLTRGHSRWDKYERRRVCSTAMYHHTLAVKVRAA